MYDLTPLKNFPEPHLYFGLDLGRRQDPSTLVILERASLSDGTRDPVSFEFRRRLHFIVRHAERIALGTPYLKVIDRIYDLIRFTTQVLPGNFPVLYGHPINPHKTLVVDATGLGAPIVEFLRKMDLGANIVPITITSARTPSLDPLGGNRVPRRDLLTQLRLLSESNLLEIPKTLAFYKQLTQELLDLTDEPTTKRDDLAMALSLAIYQSTKGLKL